MKKKITLTLIVDEKDAESLVAQLKSNTSTISDRDYFRNGLGVGACWYPVDKKEIKVEDEVAGSN